MKRILDYMLPPDERASLIKWSVVATLIGWWLRV